MELDKSVRLSIDLGPPEAYTSVEKGALSLDIA